MSVRTSDPGVLSAVRSQSGDRQAALADGKRVLVVDDNEDVAISLQTLVTVLGHQVCCAFSGGEALSVAGEFDPEIVLLDVGLPDIDGLQLAAQLRAQCPASKIIVISGYADQARSRDTSGPYEAWLTKPAGIKALLSILNEAKASAL